MSDLKPCPFCGTTTELEEQRFFDIVGMIYSIECKKCRYTRVMSLVSMEAAKMKWNTRPAEDAKDKEIERLKAELENALLILKQIDWLYSEANEKARMWELKIGGLSPTEWMCDIVQKTREFIANAPDTNVGTKGGE